MAFDLPNEHPLARHMSMCRAHNQLPLITRPILDIERTLQVAHATRFALSSNFVLQFMLQPTALSLSSHAFA
jgi:hypothetical protein